MKIYAVYQVNNGGTGVHISEYLLKGLFLNREKAEEEAPNLIRGHEYYDKRIVPIYIPDGALAAMFKASIEMMEDGESR